MDMQVRFVATAGVANFSQKLSSHDSLPLGNAQASSAKVRQQHLRLTAGEQHTISRKRGLRICQTTAERIKYQ